MSLLPHTQNYSAFNSVQMLKISCFYHQVNNSFCFLNLATALLAHMSAADFFFAFWKISAANLRILWRYLQTEVRTV